MYKFLSFAINQWNNSIGMVLDMLTQSPQNFQNGSGWRIVDQIYPIFVAIGVPLVVLFFLFSFVSESVDVKKEFTLDNIIKMFCRLILAQWLTINGMYVINTVFQSVGALINMLRFNVDSVKMTIPADLEAMIENAGFLESILPFIMILLLVIMVFGLSYYMLFMVYGRFFKIYIGVILSPIAMAPLAGTLTSGTPRQFSKYMLNVALEAVIMVLAVVIYANLFSGGTLMKPGDNMWDIPLYLIQLAFIMFCVVGGIKLAETTVSKYLGL